MKENFEIPRRSGKQCRERWFNQLDKNNLTRKWTEAEDLQLIQIQAKLGARWTDISQHFLGR
jgi:myb proto-oncogene protein